MKPIALDAIVGRFDPCIVHIDYSLNSLMGKCSTENRVTVVRFHLEAYGNMVSMANIRGLELRALGSNPGFPLLYTSASQTSSMV